MLVILDRNVDLVPMLSHSWTYQALVNDILGMKLNRVSVEVRLLSSSSPRSSLLPSSLLTHLTPLSLPLSLAPSSPQAPDGGKMSKKTYDLDAKDFFWAKNAQNPFPQVAEEIDLELNKCVSPFRSSHSPRARPRKVVAVRRPTRCT